MEKPPTKPFNIKLSDEHRAKLETYRAARGLRSEADAVRDLIERYSGVDAEDERFIAGVEDSLRQGARGVRSGGRRFTLREAAPHVDVPVYAAKPFNPQPKTGKAKR